MAPAREAGDSAVTRFTGWFASEKTNLGLTPQALRIRPLRGLSHRSSRTRPYTNHTLVVRYNFNRFRAENQGIGGFTLPERGFDLVTTNQNIQLTETAILNSTTRLSARVHRAAAAPQRQVRRDTLLMSRSTSRIF